MFEGLESFQGKRVLITGGLGFIGSNLAHVLAEAGAHLTLVDNLLPGAGGNWHHIDGIRPQVRVVEADLRDSAQISDLVEGQEFLFNLAGKSSHLDSMEDPLTDLEVNCRAQLSILEACRLRNPAIQIVFASTRQVYGVPVALPVSETHPINPVDVNGINKMAGERYHNLYHQVYGMRTCCLRLTNTYGPRMRIADAHQTFLGEWIRLLLQRDLFDVWGGSQLRDFTYVDDAIQAMVAAALNERSWGQVFNLGGCEALSLLELAKLLVEVNGGGSFRVVEYPEKRRRIDIGDFIADYRRIRETLGWQPRVGLREGLSRTLRFYRDHLKEYL